MFLKRRTNECGFVRASVESLSTTSGANQLTLLFTLQCVAYLNHITNNITYIVLLCIITRANNRKLSVYLTCQNVDCTASFHLLFFLQNSFVYLSTMSCCKQFVTTPLEINGCNRKKKCRKFTCVKRQKVSCCLE